MATTKKPQVTKKTSAKKATVKKATAKKAKAAPLTWRFYVVAIGIFVIAVSAFIVMALLTASTVQKNTSNERTARVQAIYSAINPGDGYQIVETRILGEKQVYKSDPGRTYPSIIEYVHADTVNNTASDLDAKIKAAGFTFMGQLHPEATFTEYVYKSVKGEYVFLVVSSKPYDDAVHNAAVMKRNISDAEFAMDKNAGPSTVLIKVNLDGNSE